MIEMVLSIQHRFPSGTHLMMVYSYSLGPSCMGAFLNLYLSGFLVLVLPLVKFGETVSAQVRNVHSNLREKSLWHRERPQLLLAKVKNVSGRIGIQ